ncbi:hypothetical protein OH492_28950 [Vibrio chagasii]|nr:hypothetical protein [Vibrio chagasii]
MGLQKYHQAYHAIVASKKLTASIELNSEPKALIAEGQTLVSFITRLMVKMFKLSL